MIDRRVFIASTAATLAAPCTAFSQTSEFGHFLGEFVGRFVGGQTAIVEKPLTFVGPNGQAWEAPAGIEVNGASIPRVLWSLVGSPFGGDYLRASVVHDHYCVTMERNWRDTHLAFYNGCRADGLSKTYANLLYMGVMRFGPRWRPGRGLTGADGRPRRREPAFNQQEFDELKNWLEDGDRSIEDIEARLNS
ncbi:MAG: DUF1353 domain-containing protein [Rhodobacteraceae bacterium]|nr:DUF1353 domain-containing protein [Paracoccaceae bacterium]